MRKAAFLFFIPVFVFAGCRTQKPPPASPAAGTGDRLRVNIRADNLSEDGTRISSQNDEIIFLAYLITDPAAAPVLLLSEYFVLDSANRVKTLHAAPAKMESENELCFVLIEMDSDKNKEQVEPVVRVNLAAIRKAYETTDVETYGRLLGDDDLLGVSATKVFQVNRQTGTSFTVRGLHAFDSYSYELFVDY